MNVRAKAIKNAIKMYGSSSHPSKKAAPGISYNELTPKERHYRGQHEERTNKRRRAFESSGYGQHLAARERNRGERD